MSIIPVNIPVPVSGDGPIVSIANLVGEKTVQLSGLFEGYYDLLATHNGVDFVAVASFDASGPEGIKQTVPGAFSAVRLRSNAQAITAVVCEVSGVSGVGENGFGTIASIGAGFSGLTPIVDTSIFITPSGSEVDTNFICRGDFTGAIVVLGSIDGLEFNPIGEFRVDRRPEGSPPSSSFLRSSPRSPCATCASTSPAPSRAQWSSPWEVAFPPRQELVERSCQSSCQTAPRSTTWPWDL